MQFWGTLQTVYESVFISRNYFIQNDMVFENIHTELLLHMKYFNTGNAKAIPVSIFFLEMFWLLFQNFFF